MVWSEECFDNQDSPRNSLSYTHTLPLSLKGVKTLIEALSGVLECACLHAEDKGDPEWGKNGLLSSNQGSVHSTTKSFVKHLLCTQPCAGPFEKELPLCSRCYSPVDEPQLPPINYSLTNFSSQQNFIAHQLGARPCWVQEWGKVGRRIRNGLSWSGGVPSARLGV